MGLWFSTPSLPPDETVTYRVAANLFKGRRAIGGQLTVTPERLIFMPNRLDAMTGGQRHDLALADITHVRIAPAGTKAAGKRPPGAALQPQVEIDHPGGTLVVIVRDVPGLEKALSVPGASSPSQ